MATLSKDESRKVEVVDDQFGQPTYSIDLANQILEMVSKEVPSGIYHGTNRGSTSWFGFAREIFDAMGADSGRVVPIDSSGILTKSS